MAINGVEGLVFWSIVALVTRIVGLTALCYIVHLQLKQFRTKSSLQPLKVYLLTGVIALLLSNIPVAMLNFVRINRDHVPPELASVATVCTAFGILVFAFMQFLVYKFKDKG